MNCGGSLELSLALCLKSVAALQFTLAKFEFSAVHIWGANFLPHDAMHKRGLCRHAVSVSLCVSVCLSVTFVSCIKTNKHIIKIFSPSVSDAILVFSCQTA